MNSITVEQAVERQQAVGNRLTGRTAVVVGASQGLGRGVAGALAEAGSKVVAVSRTQRAGSESVESAQAITWEIADAVDATVPKRILDRYNPDFLVIVAGASPHMRPLQQQTWESFSAHWESDVKITFHWLREALLKPLRPGARVVVISSGAALYGSPLSGGYAGAKATQRFISAYAQEEARRAGLAITFSAVLPRFSPETGVGRPAVRAYAARGGQSVEAYLEELVRTGGPLVTPEVAGSALIDLLTQAPADVAPGYVLSGNGLKRLP